MKNLRKITSFIVPILILTLLLPAVPVEGELEADFSVSASRIYTINEEDYHYEIYVNEDVSFNGGASKGEKGYEWHFGEGDPVYKETSVISHKYNSTGTYTVRLTVNDDDNNTDTIYGNMTVVEKPLAILEVTDENGDSLAPDYAIEPGQVIILNASKSEGDIRTYYFGLDLDEVFIAQVQKESPQFYYSYNSTGQYNLGLRIVDRLGNRSVTDSNDFIRITVNETSNDDGNGDESTDDDESDPLMFLALFILLAILIAIIISVFLSIRKPKDPYQR